MRRYLILIIAIQFLGCAHSVYDPRINYGDFSPKILARQAWAALDHKDYKGVTLYTGKCIELYAEAARVINEINFGPDKNEIKEYRLLNDVAQCFLIRAEASFQNKEYEKAKENFAFIIEYFDKSEVQEDRPWKPAEFARQRISEIDKKQGGGKTKEGGHGR